MRDTFSTTAERDEYFDALVDQERKLFERKMAELRRELDESMNELESRRALAVVGDEADALEDVEGDEMQDDEEAGVL